MIIINEFRTIVSRYSIVLVLLGGIFVYGVLYNYMYAPNLIREAPVVVVNQSESQLSREYIRLLDATSQVSVIASDIGFPEACDYMKTGTAVGMIYIPFDFANRIACGEQSVFVSYETTKSFLLYMALEEALSGTLLSLDKRCCDDMLPFLPAEDVTNMMAVQPITVVGTPLYNITEGYGTYLIPSVLIVIVFQTLMMVIGMLSGDERDTNSIVRFVDRKISFGCMTRIVIGKTYVYCMLYAVFLLFLLGWMPLLFGLPSIGKTIDIIIVLVPFLLATCFLGLTVSIFFTDAEAPLLMIAFFSVGLIFLSGVSYPLELMPWYWNVFHFLLPVAPATLSYVQLNSMGATIDDIRVEYVALWIQCFVYFFTACWAYQYNIRKGVKRVIR